VFVSEKRVYYSHKTVTIVLYKPETHAYDRFTSISEYTFKIHLTLLT